jgi:hypothetical protein
MSRSVIEASPTLQTCVDAPTEETSHTFPEGLALYVLDIAG